ncbi:unnamed protein product [Cochlearia groenlandica]
MSLAMTRTNHSIHHLYSAKHLSRSKAELSHHHIHLVKLLSKKQRPNQSPIKSRPKYPQGAKPKHFINLVPIAQRTKPQDLMKKSKSSIKVQQQESINESNHYELKDKGGKSQVIILGDLIDKKKATKDK